MQKKIQNCENFLKSDFLANLENKLLTSHKNVIAIVTQSAAQWEKQLAGTKPDRLPPHDGVYVAVGAKGKLRLAIEKLLDAVCIR